MDTFGHMNNNLTSKLLKIFPLYFPYLLNTSTDGHTDLTVRSFMRYNSFSALVSFLSQVKILSPFLFSSFDELDHQSLRQMGEGHVYIYVQRSVTPHSAGVLLSPEADLHLIIWPCSKTIIPFFFDLRVSCF